MNAVQALKVIEELRKGIPPTGFVEKFTVGRKEEIAWLDTHLSNGENYALLLKANYGSGKSHLLQLIREKALKAGFAVSLVTLDANSGVRFNRMDQIFGAIMRSLEVPIREGIIGGLSLALDLFVEAAEAAKASNDAPGHAYWSEVTNNWRHDYSEKLGSAPLFIALRAWAVTDDKEIRDLVVDWLSNPDAYRTRRAELYDRLIVRLRKFFRDPRRERRFYSDGHLVFNPDDYRNCWKALEDFQQLFKSSGIPGLVILFDEFEDVLTNLRRINLQEDAFWNLFRFVSGDRFTGKTFYAVTPAFVDKCKVQLMLKGRWDFDYSQFDGLPTFAMSPLEAHELLELADRIAETHRLAFEYEVTQNIINAMRNAVAEASRSPVQDRARQVIRTAVRVLDEFID